MEIKMSSYGGSYVEIIIRMYAATVAGRHGGSSISSTIRI